MQGYITKKRVKKGEEKTKTKVKTTLITFGNLISPKELKNMFGECEVTCIDNQRRLWIVPTIKENGEGFAVFKTSYIGDVPHEIGFAPTAEEAREYLFQHHGIPVTAWKKCPIISMVNTEGAMA